MRRTCLFLLPQFFLALILLSCGTSGLISTVEIKITPSTKTISTGESVTFTGTETTTNLTGLTISTEADAFFWQITEGAAGGTLVKTSGDTTTYTYTAPGTAGTFHVEIQSRTDSTQTARATVTVN